MSDAPIPLARPLLGREEEEAIAEVLRSGWLVQGPRVAALESALVAATGAPHACAVANGTAALELALRAVGVGPGDRVIAPTYSFVATANAIRAVGAEPVFADIDPATGNIAAADVEQRLADPPIAAIVAVHQVGMPADLSALCAVAERFSIPLIEDAACAIGSEWRDRAGAWHSIGGAGGTIATLSFHPRKLITCGEGGAVLCRDPQIDRLVRQLRDHGREAGRCLRAGFNQRMSDVHAAIAEVQLGRLDGIVAGRRRAVDRYRAGLGDIAGVRLPNEPAWARSNWQSLIAMVDPDRDRDGLIAGLAAAGISSQSGIGCAHLEAPYGGASRADLAASEDASRRGLTLPLYPEMADADIDRVCAELARLLGGH